MKYRDLLPSSLSFSAGSASRETKTSFQRRMCSMLIVAVIGFGASELDAQEVSIDALEAAIDARLAAVNPFNELLNDPDQRRSLAAMEIMIGSQDEALARMAIQHGLASRQPEIRSVAAMAAYEHWNDLSALNLDTQSQVAVVASLTATGALSEAVDIAEASVQQIQMGSADVSSVELTNNLAFLYAKTGRSSEAEPLFASVLNTAQTNFGDLHPQTITAQNNLAVLYAQLGRLSESESLLKMSLSSQTEIFGEENPNTLVSMSNLAGLYVVQGRFEEAVDLYEATLQGSESVLGRSHPDTVLIRDKLEEATQLALDEDGDGR